MAEESRPVAHASFARIDDTLQAQLEALHGRLTALERRIEQRLGELRAKQEEELILLKAVSCQIRGRAERVERRMGR